MRTPNNALNLIRLGLAVTVLLGHSWDLVHGSTAGRPLPWSGSVAVDGFFAISGFLIVRSRARLGFVRYLLHRGARILPAFWVCLALTAFVLAPIAGRVTGAEVDWSESSAYVWRNAGLQINQLTIGDTLKGAPFGWVWNPSLWTLWIETLCYLFFGLLFTGRWNRGPVLAGVLFAFAVMSISGGDQGPPAIVRLGAFFAAGALLQVLRHRVPDSGSFAVAAAVVLGCLFLANVGIYEAVAPLPMAYTLLWLGSHLPTAMASETDLSYGVYIFGGPLQQVAVVSGVGAAVGPIWFALLSLAITVPLALLSWLIIERPILGAVRRARRRGGVSASMPRLVSLPSEQPGPSRAFRGR